MEETIRLEKSLATFSPGSLYMASARDTRFVAMAAEEATRSPCGTRVGCICVLNGRPIAKGFNNYRTYSKDGIIGDSFTCHAECDVIHKVNNMFRTRDARRRKVVQECSSLHGPAGRLRRAVVALHTMPALSAVYPRGGD